MGAPYAGRDLERVAKATPVDGGYTLLGVPMGAAVNLTATSTTLVTPPTGQAVRLRWVYLGSLSGVNETVATIKIGSTTHYMVPLSSPGAFAKTSVRDGAADEALVAELSPASSVYIDYEYELFTP